MIHPYFVMIDPYKMMTGPHVEADNFSVLEFYTYDLKNIAYIALHVRTHVRTHARI